MMTDRYSQYHHQSNENSSRNAVSIEAPSQKAESVEVQSRTTPKQRSNFGRDVNPPLAVLSSPSILSPLLLPTSKALLPSNEPFNWKVLELSLSSNDWNNTEHITEQRTPLLLPSLSSSLQNVRREKEKRSMERSIK